MTDTPCELVIKHHEILGGIAADIAHIKKTVDNGLSKKLDDTVKELNIVQTLLQKQKSDAEMQFVKIDSSNWFTKVLTGSFIKVSGIVIMFMFLNAIMNSGIGLFVKDKISLEPPGQQRAILDHQVDIKSYLDASYHSHVINGRAVLHAGDPNKPAFIFNEATKNWDRAPLMRTEEGVK
jgi:hypothetical protein